MVIEAVDTTEQPAEFWLTARGPIGQQPELLERLKRLAADMEGVTVDVGTVGG